MATATVIHFLLIIIFTRRKSGVRSQESSLLFLFALPQTPAVCKWGAQYWPARPPIKRSVALNDERRTKNEERRTTNDERRRQGRSPGSPHCLNLIQRWHSTHLQGQYRSAPSAPASAAPGEVGHSLVSLPSTFPILFPFRLYWTLALRRYPGSRITNHFSLPR